VIEFQRVWEGISLLNVGSIGAVGYWAGGGGSLLTTRRTTVEVAVLDGKTAKHCCSNDFGLT